ncbi:putative bifunctional aspartate aminotransferase and L-aspartate beta-decarboxylase [Nocardia nova SH22a]|uniref:Putative bifunctional aspartate aminotransferase and L-aspartate beta-decarboxylase n=1 Tax=Nocardia nova SH22a TaxID=1415166 RepID=W5TUW8_9NOCA|nr:bifunctional aspartate transaminase/aspartate 4-decarboxylase [Nocardia nova]AHH20966.1 putative bifunctional aspartate aminotransferase and L-aspartate beta-decarboxylase [Nocardia nova SH22a]
MPIENIAVNRATEKEYEQLSPFELKNELIELADEGMRKTSHTMINAGRGNPNWTSIAGRESFYLLGQFAAAEARRNWTEFPELAGMPQTPGIASRLDEFLADQPPSDAVTLLRGSVHYGVAEMGFDADEWVGELADAIHGDHYPVPDRMLPRIERVVHRYLDHAMGGAPEGGWDLFATEGGTAAMCYLFDSCVVNGLLATGDRIAIMTPIFAPYLEIPHLQRYQFDVLELPASMTSDTGMHTWQYPPEEIEKLADPAIKALFLVNPSNPPSVKLDDATLERIAHIAAHENPNLTIITDDVYGTFVDGFRSLMSVAPANTLGVYSFSKYFGCTGWRLGVIAVARDNAFDRRIAALPAADRDRLTRRYSSIALDPAHLRFIDRMVADSRDVALNHTAGLSTPQQVQMALFALGDLLEQDRQHHRDCQAIIARRLDALCGGLGVPVPRDPNAANYYVEIDLLVWVRQKYSPEFADWLRTEHEPVDPIFRLAQQGSVVLLNGGGFDAPQWSVRVSLANLAHASYTRIGRWLTEVIDEYHLEYTRRATGR